MDGILHGYQISEETWFYHSLLLIVAVFFRFNRFWSIRNVDLALLLSISPSALLAKYLEDQTNTPSLVTYTTTLSAVVMIRLLFDGVFHRRPRLNQNLNISGLLFLCLASFAFLMTNVFTKNLPDSAVRTVQRGSEFVQKIDTNHGEETVDAGPTSSILAAGMGTISKTVAPDKDTAKLDRLTAQLMAVFAHAAVLGGLIFIGWRHFGDIQIGVAMGTLYLLLPCTAFDVHKVNHVLPAAFIIWAVAAYRRPIISGGLLGMACGTLFFSIFLLPVWTMFYGRKRGGLRFAASMLLVSGVLLATLLRTAADGASLQSQLIGTIKWSSLRFVGDPTAPELGGLSNNVRIPLFAAFCVLLTVLSIWPRRKNLEHLIAHTAAVIVTTQVWYPQQTGMYFLWYVPILLLVIFRPRLHRLLPPKNLESNRADTRLPRDTADPQPRRSTNVRNGLFR